MGNKYSQISTDIFPSNCFILIFRQPDTIQAINAETCLIANLTDILETYWQYGIKNEKKIKFGLELKLNNNPFSNEPKSIEKITQINHLLCAILSNIISSGYEIVSSGYIIRSFERSSFIFRKKSERINIKLTSSSICSIIFEGWNRIIINNIDESVRKILLKEAASLLVINIKSIKSENNFVIIELDGQPWDSHKTNSVKSPLLLLNLIELIIQCGYKVLCKAHVTGYNDTILLIKDYDNLVSCNEYFLLSLNQLDQLRTYNASSKTINNLSKIVKSFWEKGIHSDLIQDKIWICHLNGSPWSIANWDKDSSFSSKLLLMEILKELRNDGWKVILSVKLYRSQYDKSLFIFQKIQEKNQENHFFCIGPHDADRLCLTNSPKGLINQLRDKFSDHWNKGIREDSYENGCNEYILEGRPWLFTDESLSLNIEAIGFFCWALEHIWESGWSMLETADICSTSAYSPTEYLFSNFYQHL